MMPVVNFDWISFVAGMTSIRFVPFFVASFLGMLLPTFVAVAVPLSAEPPLKSPVSSQK